MSRAFMLLALLALVCVWVSASPASKMADMLNGVQKNLHKTALQDAFAESDINAEMRYADALLAQKQPEVVYASGEKPQEGLSFAQSSEGFEMELDLSRPGRKSRGGKKKKATKKNIVKSLKLTTGSAGKANSQCFACQYYVQRFLGGLLGPFYQPNVPGYPIERSTLYTPTNSPTSFLEVGEEVEEEEMDAEEYASAFLELESQVMVSLPEAPSSEVAVEQYTKWEPFLSFIETSADKGGKKSAKKSGKKSARTKKSAPAKKSARGKKALTRKQKIAAATDKIRGLAFPDNKSVSTVRDPKGKLYAGKDLFAAKRFFSRICNRRTPYEYIPVCRTLFAKLEHVVEELNVGDRPDEVCVRLNLCSGSSYLVKRAHSTLRKKDI